MIVTQKNVFQRFNNERVQAYNISEIYLRMYIHYPIPISSLICSNWSEILICKVPVLAVALILYVNRY